MSKTKKNAFDKILQKFWAIIKWFYLKYLNWVYKGDIPYSEDINETDHCPNCGLHIDMDDCFNNPSFIGSTQPYTYGINGTVTWTTHWKCVRCRYDWTEDESN